MVATYRLKGLGWLASCALVAIGFYLVSSQVAAERKKLAQIDARIASADRDIRALETEFDVRANLAQLEKWNGDTLSLTVPTARQYLPDEAALAALSPRQLPPVVQGESGVQLAALIVPSTPVVAAPLLPVRPAPPAVSAATLVKVAVARAQKPAMPRVTPVSATAADKPRLIRAVAMVDVGSMKRGLLSDNTIGDLMSGARRERGRLQ